MRSAVVDLASQPVTNYIRNPDGSVPTGSLSSSTGVPTGRTSARITGVTDGPGYGLTSYVRLEATAATNNLAGYGAFTLDLPVGSYEGSFFVRPSHAISGRVWFEGTSDRTSNNNAMTALPAGVWTRMKGTIGVLVGGNLKVAFLSNNLDLPVGATVDLTGFMITDQASAPDSFVDGNSPGWRWTGTVGASPSVGYRWALDPKIVRQLIRNLAVNPSFEFATSNAGTANGATLSRIQAAGRHGLYGIRVTCPANGIGDSGVGLASQANIVAGRTYTYSVFVRAVTAGRVVMYLSGNSGGTATRFYTPQLAAGEVYRLSATYTATGTGTIGQWWVLRAQTGAAEDVFDIDGVMVTEGSTLYPYADGSTPGWSWAGAVHGSDSSGYPYTLESIAGTPLAVARVGENGGVTPIPTVLAPTAGRSLYCVFDVVDTSADYVTYMSGWTTNSSSTEGRISFGTGASGTSLMSTRFDAVNGGVNQTASVSGIRTAPGPHVGAVTLNEGMTVMVHEVDGLAANIPRRVTTPGSGFTSPTPTLRVFPLGRIAYAFAGEHDDATRRQIIAWLARQYGAPVPTGY